MDIEAFVISIKGTALEVLQTDLGFSYTGIPSLSKLKDGFNLLEAHLDSK